MIFLAFERIPQQLCFDSGCIIFAAVCVYVCPREENIETKNRLCSLECDGVVFGEREKNENYCVRY